MKLLKYLSIFAVVCILMTCVVGTAMAAGSKTVDVEITPSEGLEITPMEKGDPELTKQIAASKVDGCKVEEIVDKPVQWNMTAEKTPVTVTIKVDLKENQKGYVYHWNGSDWQLMGEVNTPITFNSLSPVGYAIRQLGTTPAPGGDGGKETSPETGSNGLLLSLACAAVLMGGAVAYVSTKKKI